MLITCMPPSLDTRLRPEHRPLGNSPALSSFSPSDHLYLATGIHGTILRAIPH